MFQLRDSLSRGYSHELDHASSANRAGISNFPTSLPQRRRALLASTKGSRKGRYRDGNYPGVTSSIWVETVSNWARSRSNRQPNQRPGIAMWTATWPLSVRARLRRGRGVLQEFWGREAPGPHARQRGEGPSFEPFMKPAGLRRPSGERHVHARRAARVHRWTFMGLSGEDGTSRILPHVWRGISVQVAGQAS